MHELLFVTCIWSCKKHLKLAEKDLIQKSLIEALKELAIGIKQVSLPSIKEKFKFKWLLQLLVENVN